MRDVYDANLLEAPGDLKQVLSWLFAASVAGGSMPDPTGFSVEILVDGAPIAMSNFAKVVDESGATRVVRAPLFSIRVPAKAGGPDDK